MDKPELIKKDRFIMVFYVLYFGWLLLTTYLSQDNYYNNLLIVFVTVVYFVFLRESMDLLIFAAATAVSYYVLGKINGFPEVIYDYDYLKQMSLWIFVSWGFTAVALKKLFFMISRRVEL